MESVEQEEVELAVNNMQKVDAVFGKKKKKIKKSEYDFYISVCQFLSMTNQILHSRHILLSLA